MFITQLTRLLSVPPGDLVYHLVVLFAMWAALLLALGQGRRAGWHGAALRATITLIGLLVLRGISVAVALAAAGGAVNPAWVMPPLERWASVASLGLLAWAFLHWMDDYPQAGLVLVVVNTIGSVILYALFAPQWQRDAQSIEIFYNATQADGVWAVWAVVIGILSTATAFVRRRAQWGLVATFFATLAIGHVLHLTWAEPQTHVAGWVRLAELCAYPLLAGLMLIRTTEQEAPPAALPASLALGTTPATAPWTVIEACQRVSGASTISAAVQRAGVAISNLLGAEVLAVGIMNKPGDSLDLVAVCRAGSAPRTGPSFDVASQTPVALALQRRRGGLVDQDQDGRLATLAALVGGASGPLWVQPLIHQGAAVGVLILGRATSRAPDGAPSGWTASEIETINGLCSVLAHALVGAGAVGGLNQQVGQLQAQLRERKLALSQTQTQVQQLAAQLAEADTQRKRTLPPRAPHPALKPVSPPAPEPSVVPASEKRLKVRVQLDPRTPLKPARAMMVLTHIKRIGRIVACDPVEADLRSGGFADEFTVTFSTDSEPASVRAALLAIRDVLDVETHLI